MISHLTLKVKYDYLQSSKERLKVEILPNRETPSKKFFHEHTFLAHQLLERRFVLYFFNVPWWYQGDVQLPHNILLQNLLRGSSSNQKYSSFVSLGHLPPSVLPLTPPCWQSRHELEESGLGTILYEEPALSPPLNWGRMVWGLSRIEVKLTNRKPISFSMHFLRLA